MTTTRIAIRAMMAGALLMAPVTAGQSAAFADHQHLNDLKRTFSDFWDLKKGHDKLIDYSERARDVVAAVSRQFGALEVSAACSLVAATPRENWFDVLTSQQPWRSTIDSEFQRCCTDHELRFNLPASDILGALLPSDLGLGHSLMPLDVVLSLADEIFAGPVLQEVKDDIRANAIASSHYSQCGPLIDIARALP